MRVILNGNAVTVVSDIDANYADAKGLVVTNEEGDEVYVAKRGRAGSISKYGITYNTVTDGKLSAAWFEDEPVDRDAFKLQFTAAVAALKTYGPLINQAAADATEAYDSIWAGVFDDEEIPEFEITEDEE